MPNGSAPPLPVYTTAEFDAAMTALNAMIAAEVPWYEQGAITQNIKASVINAVLTAAAKVRN